MTFTQTHPFDHFLGSAVLFEKDTVNDFVHLSDEALLARTIKAPSAFEELLRRYQKDFLERAQFVVKSREEAEDVVQDTFVRIYRFAPRFDPTHGSFRSWAMTILMNVARTRYQKQARGWERTVVFEQEHLESIAEPDTKEAMLAHDTMERALRTAPEDVARILRFAFIDGLTYEEIGEKEGISIGAVKTRVHRAKKVLKKIINNQNV